VAVTILAIAGVVAVSMSSEAMRATAQAADAEREILEASTLLDAVALWPREDLDRRLGSRLQGPWRMYIERTSPTLYEVILTDTSSRRVLLQTTVFRPGRDSEHP
jgi:hypothetical protein